MDNNIETSFDDWLREQLHGRRWSVMDLARAIANAEGIRPDELDRRARAISSNISKARLGKGTLGDAYARKVAAALGLNQADVFRAAGLITDENATGPASTKRPMDTAATKRKAERTERICALLDLVSAAEQDEGVALLETFVQNRIRMHQKNTDQRINHAPGV